MPSPIELFDAAFHRRAPLIAAGVTALRLFHGLADGIDGFVLERFGPVLVAQIHEGRLAISEESAAELVAHALRKTGCTSAYRKTFVADRSGADASHDAAHRDSAPWLGTPCDPLIMIEEGPLRLGVRPYDGFSTGLFLEHRDVRRSVLEISRGRRVLNTFCYTGGFTVAAGLGGAAKVVSVDASRRYLQWCRENLAASSCDIAPQQFICSDVLEYLARAKRQGHQFDLIILDPPSFGRAKDARKAFSLASDLPKLLQGALEVAAPGAEMFLAVNNRRMSAAMIQSTIERTNGLSITRRGTLPIDFAGDPDYSKSFWLRAR